jgi:CheY-like chemotaxis protein/CRP-like cAMP-binding protein
MRLEVGDVLCAAGTPGEELFILLTGQAGIYAEDGTELAEIDAIATKQIRTSSVKAKQVSNVLVVKRVALDMALKLDPEAQAKILRNVVEILAQRMEQYTARRREDLLEKVQLNEAMETLQYRADLALGILARKSKMPLKDARALLEAELVAKDTELRVLIVDDEDHVRKMLTKVLANYDVIAVGSGAEAIDTAMETKPDLVITDINMPDMDGYALLKKLREFHPDLPVLALSGFATDTDIQQYDFDGFVSKPMDMKQFKSIVASALVGAGAS